MKNKDIIHNQYFSSDSCYIDIKWYFQLMHHFDKINKYHKMLNILMSIQTDRFGIAMLAATQSGTDSNAFYLDSTNLNDERVEKRGTARIRDGLIIGKNDEEMNPPSFRLIIRQQTKLMIDKYKAAL